MKTITVSRIVAACLLAPLAAHAQSGPREGRPERPSFDEMWQRYDVDGDGYLSQEEFNAMRRVARLDDDQRQRLFNRLDKDGDGRISREELREMRRGRDAGRHGHRAGMRRLMELDTDGSGGVSLEEFRAAEMFANVPPERVEALFHRLDTDGDGEITPRDRPELPPMMRRGDGPGQPRERSHRRIFDHLDADGSGTLGFEEFSAMRGMARLDEEEKKSLFRRLDADGDGQLSFEEFSKLPPEHLMPRRGPQRRGGGDERDE